ncbi:hypothetical protein [Caballeronia sp. LZ035]|uniref:hypothetical protein n=1 Tax=Caballeronia sp. LZ035 TaxID=3038568 RepID=UPI0028631237|nr:hypothetical protein [Caballeronia sp. LZ035]MDR5761446.1 hypothetical protein [Caballeronia sp. LZ035]
MDTPTANGAASTPRTARPGKCADAACVSGSRNRYFVGKRMTPDALGVEQGYLIGRRRLLNRAIHGWGVVYGFPIAIPAADASSCASEPGTLQIGEGLALDEAGRELVQPDAVTLTLDDLVVLDRQGAPVRTTGGGATGGIASMQPKADECWLLQVHYAERRIGPVTLRDPCSCERCEWNQICETVCYSLQRVDCAGCCIDHPCELTCDCGSGPCCETHADRTGAPKRGGSQCLCEHLTALSPNPPCECLQDLDEITRADLCNGVALACVTLEPDARCGGWRLKSVFDACGPRRLVKRNDALYDLVRGCDLTTISAFGWESLVTEAQPASFDAFSKAFGPDGIDEPEYVTALFWVEFSRPVLAGTLLPSCFAITVIGPEDEGKWWGVQRVPIVAVQTDPVPGKDATGRYTRRATMVVNGGWLESAMRGRDSIFLDGVTHIEVQVHGDLIVDCNQQAVDCGARGAVPAGSGVPGGTFLSVFTVARRPELPPKQKPVASSPSSGGASS